VPTALLVLLCAAICSAAEEDPNRAFEALFGQESQKVERTSGKADDAALAKKLLAAAANAPDSPKFQVLLYEKAYALGMESKGGYATSVEAMRRLAGAEPQRRAECDTKLLAVYERQYRYGLGTERVEAGATLSRHLQMLARAEVAAGETDKALATCRRAYAIARVIRSADAQVITERINALLVRQRLDREMASLQRALAARPDDRRAAGRLLMLHLVEKNDPNKAAALLPSVIADEAMKTCLPMATKPWHELDENACLDLGGWYRTLAAKASADARPRMLARAKAYYETYRTLHGKADATAIRATMPLEKLNQELAPLGWIDCGFLPPPKGVTKALAEWTKHRDALPVKQRLAALEKKLSEACGGKKISARSHKIEGGRIVSLGFRGNKDLTSIAPLYGMKLRSLNLEDTRLATVEPLRGMKLQELDLWGCPKLTGLEGLEGMQLAKLSLYGGRHITSLEPLRGMPLTSLQLRYCGMKSLKGLEGMPLEDLDCGNCGSLENIEAIKGMRLRRLSLAYSDGIKSFRPLRGLPLRELGLRHSSFRDLRLLKGMPLRSLDLSGIPVTSLEPLRGMELTRLTVGGKELRSLSGIEDMPLELLDIGGTKFATKRVADSLKQEIPTLKEVKIK